MKPSLCCWESQGLDQSAAPAKIVALEYYDGPTAGLLQCGVCSSVWWFEMIDSDGACHMRVFTLAPMPDTSFAQLVEACMPLGEPRWPVWVPLWQFPDEDQRRQAEARVDIVLRTAGAVQTIVAALGILKPLRAARQLSPSEAFDIGDPPAARDWFAFLNLERDADSDD